MTSTKAMRTPPAQPNGHVRLAADDGATTASRTSAAPAAFTRVSSFERLAQTLREQLAQAAAGGHPKTEIGECLLDLDRLHGRMLQELGGSQRRIAELQSALSAAHVGERRARRDPLTRLPNRDVFLARLANELARSDAPRQVAVFYLDLDRFKAINDQHGHGTGDAVLRIVAARLNGVVRARDLVCRIGGDEFIYLASGAPDQASLRRIAAKLLDAVAAPLCIGALSLEVRTSIGIANWPEGGTTVGALVANADAALYQAKRRRSGHAFFEEEHQGNGLRFGGPQQA